MTRWPVSRLYVDGHKFCPPFLALRPAFFRACSGVRLSSSLRHAWRRGSRSQSVRLAAISGFSQRGPEGTPILHRVALWTPLRQQDQIDLRMEVHPFLDQVAVVVTGVVEDPVEGAPRIRGHPLLQEGEEGLPIVSIQPFVDKCAGVPFGPRVQRQKDTKRPIPTRRDRYSHLPSQLPPQAPDPRQQPHRRLVLVEDPLALFPSLQRRSDLLQPRLLLRIVVRGAQPRTPPPVPEPRQPPPHRGIAERHGEGLRQLYPPSHHRPEREGVAFRRRVHPLFDFDLHGLGHLTGTTPTRPILQTRRPLPSVAPTPPADRPRVALEHLRDWSPSPTPRQQHRPPRARHQTTHRRTKNLTNGSPFWYTCCCDFRCDPGFDVGCDLTETLPHRGRDSHSGSLLRISASGIVLLRSRLTHAGHQR